MISAPGMAGQSVKGCETGMMAKLSHCPRIESMSIRFSAISRSRAAYFLQKQGDRGFRNVGSAYRRSKDTFRKRIACYIDDDPTLAERIRQSNAYRDKTILMLHDYDPTRH